MLRVAHLTPAYFSPASVVGGGERYVYYVAQALRGVGGFEQCVMTAGIADGRFDYDGIAVRVLRNGSPSASAMDSVTAGLWRELRGFDLVHIHQSLTQYGAYATAIARSLGIPAIGTDLGGGENDLMLRGQGIKLLSGAVSISHYAQSLISGFYKGPQEVLIGPIDTDRFTPCYGVARDRRTVLCVSRILPHKGIDRVIAALPAGLRLIVVGRVSHEKYYEMLCGLASGKDVQFVHDADDEKLLSLYRSAGLFVQASTVRDIYGTVAAKPELMGLTTLEAMAAGLAVAVSDAGSLPELVSDPRFSRVFAGNDELQATLHDVLSGTWPRPDVAPTARAHVVANHGMASIGQRLAAFYRDVASRTHAA